MPSPSLVHTPDPLVPAHLELQLVVHLARERDLGLMRGLRQYSDNAAPLYYHARAPRPVAAAAKIGAASVAI
eukprot:CAMPEP_0183333514 /NCGR_PEP_ID=MMETSP0164_2-20130417/2396_1 /TAXON_ID=221442 /ORGANISM="Coccolithus pelagicus ssp braarudi, Strain PLY182g" /LENGTH=71 /DNA_ID=CAMNT_0025502457 /DNA_START=114 /DNA_END=329 /DNA_ORIENTATION=-